MTLNKLKRNVKGQTTTEYIVLVSIVVGIVLALFTGPLQNALQGGIQKIATAIGH